MDRKLSVRDNLKVILSLDSIRYPLTGIGRYAYELAKGISASTEVSDFKFQFRFGWCHNPDELLVQSQDPTPSKDGLGVWYSTIRDAYRKVAPAIKGMRLIGHRDYLFHSTNYALPWFTGPMVSTVHDMSCFRHPEFHPIERVDHMRRLFPQMLKRADLFITVSDFSKTELVSLCGVDPDRVLTTYLGKDERFKPREYSECEKHLNSLGLTYQSYTLTVGTIEPRKNIDALIDAYHLLPKELRMLYPLVIVGDAGWSSWATHGKIVRYVQEGWLKYLSYVPEGILPFVYSGALAFGYVSLYEGFGLPVLEAMASGVPVVASRVASIPEVGGDAVRYVHPQDIEEIGSTIERLLLDARDRQGLINAGLAQSSRFTWDNTAQQTVAAYRMLEP